MTGFWGKAGMSHLLNWDGGIMNLELSTDRDMPHGTRVMWSVRVHPAVAAGA